MKRIVRASKVSMKKNSKNLNVKRFESMCFKISTVIERSIYKMIPFVEHSLNFWGEIQKWSNYLLIF